MIKEELEKEAEIFVSEKANKGNFDVVKFGKAYFSESSMKQALVKFAEPREKRIAELEAQIEKMKCCENCLYNGECDLSGYEECKNFDKWEIKENERTEKKQNNKFIKCNYFCRRKRKHN